ncbi:MAG: hypothetical protein AAGF83_07410 [Cyanobacteria bacterium P01_G01_bin.67]
MIRAFKLLSGGKFNRIFQATAVLSMAIALNSCGTSQSGAGQYEASATATYTWRVNYQHDPLEDKRGRYEKFDSTSIVNINGEKPEGAVSQDDKGIWWPKLPPKPSIDEVEAGKKKPYEKIGKPELLRQVEYRVKFNKDGERLNLPTNHAVYRQVVKNYPDTPINFTMGVNNGSVTKATPVTN